MAKTSGDVEEALEWLRELARRYGVFDDAGRLYKNPFGLDPRIINKTLDEAVQYRRERITISTFMIARDPALIDFMEEFTRPNNGRTYYSSLDHLGEYIFVDYIKNRRQRHTAR